MCVCVLPMFCVMCCVDHVEVAPVTITKPLEEVQATEGDTVTLTAEASQPQVESTWFKDDFELIPEENKFDMNTEGVSHELTIHDVETKDEGEYTLAIGDDTSTAMVWVEGKYYWSGCYFSRKEYTGCYFKSYFQ